MSTPASRRPTYEDILQAPPEVVAEIVAGELYLSPRPAIGHALASSVLGQTLGGAFHGRGGGPPERPGGWWILDEPELHFGDEVLVPDLAGWRRERLPRLADEAFFTLPPDWVCEVVSPRTARLDRMRKLPSYARAEVQHAWIVDPVARTIEVYRRLGETFELRPSFDPSAATAHLEPFEAAEIVLAALWGEE